MNTTKVVSSDFHQKQDNSDLWPTSFLLLRKEFIQEKVI